MIVTEKVSLSQLVFSLSKAVDLISPAIADHHIRTAYFAHALSHGLSLDETAAADTVTAAMLHDIGAFSLSDRLAALSFEIEKPHSHAETGWRLLRDFEPFSRSAEIIRYHH
ncbi:MAG: HD domain-containing protein, partial [Spirochaetota bacterium]